MANTVTVHLEDDQKAYVAELARRKRVRPGAVVRWAIDHFRSTSPDGALPLNSPECTCRRREDATPQAGGAQVALGAPVP